MREIKRIISMIMAAVLLFSLTACTNSADNYTDDKGNTYLVARGADGYIDVNDSGKLKVYTLNENGKRQKSDSGEYITEYIDFIGQVVDDRYVETAELEFKLPSGFSEDKNNPGYFSDSNNTGEIFIDFDATTSVDIAVTATENNCGDLLELYGSDAFSYEKYTVEVNNMQCTAFKEVCSDSQLYQTSYFYFIPYDNGYYSINCVIATNKNKKVNFDKFVQTIVTK